MKPRPTADHPVRVRPMAAEVGGAEASLYDGVYELTLNTMVSVVVVPDTGVPVDAWDPDMFPTPPTRQSWREASRSRPPSSRTPSFSAAASAQSRRRLAASARSKSMA